MPLSTGPRPSSHRRILVVDDNADAVLLLAAVLRRNGHEVHVAHNGQEGVRLAEQARPHVILMDIGMPVMDGYAACRAIRSAPWGRQMVLVALTGWGEEEDLARAQEAGFDRHLLKPVPVEKVQALLADLSAPSDG